MGLGSSRDRNTVEFNSFLNSDKKPYFIIYPEEQVINQNFKFTENDKNLYTNKENYFVTAKLLIEIFLNHTIITQEKSQFEVFKKIIIPLFSKYLITNDQKIINSILLFKYYKSISSLFLEKHNRFLSYFFQPTNQQIVLPNIDTNEMYIQSTSIFSKLVNSLFSTNSKKKFYFEFQKSTTKATTNILAFLNIEPTNIELLLNSFIWSLHICDLYLLLCTFERLFSLEKKEKQIYSKKNSFYENLPKMVIHQNFSQFFINFLHENFNGYINCTDYQLIPSNNNKSRHYIIAATSFYLFYNNHSKEKDNENNEDKEFVKVRIINNNVSDNSKRFLHFPSHKFLSCEYGMVIADNVVVFLDHNHKIMLRNSDPDYLIEKVNIEPKRSPQIELPFTSDGHFIYSFLSLKEIGVYTVDADKAVLTFVRKISIKDSKNDNLERPFKDKIISNKLLENAVLVTNGIVLELIYPEQLENKNYSHFVRVISLNKGKHVCDFRFTLPYKLESACFEPYSKSIWALSIHSEGFCFINYHYDGPDPLWMSNLKINEKLISIKSITNISVFNQFSIDYIYNIFIQFYGTACKSNDLMLSFFVRSASSQMFDYIISLFILRTSDVKFIQFLFLILSFQLKFIKLDEKQIESLYEILKLYIIDVNHFDFLVLFIVNSINCISIQYLSKYFDLIFKNSLLKDSNLLLILTRLYNSKNFSYILENEKVDLVLKLYNNTISNVEIELLMSYQSSLFRTYSDIYQSNSNLIEKVEGEVHSYTTLMIKHVSLLIANLDDIYQFNKSLFIMVFRKLVVLLKLTSVSSSFPREMLKLLLPLLKTCILNERLFVDEMNPFFYFFFDIFFLYAQFFKQILTFTNSKFFTKYEQFLYIKIEKEKNVSDVFKGQLNEDDFSKIIDLLYSKISNPMNKRLTEDDKKIEKFIFLALFHQTGTTEELVNIKTTNEKDFKISQQLRQIIQSVYRIRSNLRSKKQKEDQKEYNKLYKNIEEKCHFLLQYSSEKNDSKQISMFINDNIQISEIILAQKRLKDVQINLSMFIEMIDYVFINDFPKSCLYSFLMYLCENSDILDSFELLIKYVNFDAKKAMSFIENLLEYFNEMPPNAFLSFISIILIMISKESKDPHQCYRIVNDSLSILFGKLTSLSKSYHKKIFKSNVTFLCYFYRILCDENLITKDDNEINVITTLLQETSVNYSMSFTLAHAIMHAKFTPKNIPNIMNIIGLVSEPKFHGLTLLLFEHLLFKSKNNKDEFVSDLKQIMIIIGSVFSGSTTDKILQIAVPVSQLNNQKDNAFCRTPTSQQACALELVQLIRRLMLESESNAPKLINKYLKSLTKSVHLNDQQYMKQLYAMLAIMSNILSIKRPNTIINTNENKSYFVLSVKGKINQIVGLLLPINNQQLVIHKFFVSSDIRSSEMIPYNLSLFNNIDVPYSIFELASSTPLKAYSDCLFTFLALECVKENILDSEHGTEFSNNFNSMKIPPINKFIFKTNVPLILSLLTKSLINPTKGIFVGSPVRPVLFHTSVNQLVFEDDYTLNSEIIEAHLYPHIFISSILDDDNASFFSIHVDNADNLCHIFGVVTHSVDQNHLISITYSSQEKAFCINGKSARKFEVKNDCIFECRYLPSKNKVAFATSNDRNRVFSCVLPEKSRCSFIALMKSKTRNNYICTMKAQTECFQKNIYFGQNPIKMLQRFGNKFFRFEIDETATKFSMLTVEDKEEDSINIIQYSKEVLELGQTINEIISSPIIHSDNSYPAFKDLIETNILLTEYPNYLILPKNRSVYSSPRKLDEYFKVNEVSGRFNLVRLTDKMLTEQSIVPPFHFETFYHLPVEVINCYFSGVCELHRLEILTLYFSRIITNSTDVFSSLKSFSINTSMIVYFVTNVLLLLEPIKMTNLAENKSPIDFDSFNSLEKCAKIEMFDYFTCLINIVRSFEQQKKIEFINAWYLELDKDFHNKYMHFATSLNSRLILMNSSIVDKQQSFVQNDASGWIIFPMQFGFTTMPTIHVNNLIYPSSFSNYSTYAFSKGNKLDISIHSNDDLSCVSCTYGLLPFCQDSNESLFHSFYQLVISFKYFVLFAHKDLNESQKFNLISSLFDSIAAGSPFFYSHCDEIFSFLKDKITPSFTPDYVSKLNIFIASIFRLKNEPITHFIDEQISLYDDLKSSVFRYFISDSEKVPDNITLPKPVIPHTITINTFNPSAFLVLMSRVLLHKTRKEDFPFHLILNEWAYSFTLFPLCELNFIESNVLEIKFIAFIPSSFKLIDQDYNEDEIVYISFNGDFTKSYTQTTLKNIETQALKSQNCATLVDSNNEHKIYVMFPNQKTVSQRNLVVVSNNLVDTDSVPYIAYKCRSYFINDMNEFTNSFTVDDDQHILMKIDIGRFIDDQISTLIWPGIISTLDTRIHQPYMLFLRSIYLIAFNFVCFKNPSLMNKTSFAPFRPFISVRFSMNKFLQLIDEHSEEMYIKMCINRQLGLNARNGLSKKIDESMIGQFTYYYMKEKSHFRNKEIPFYVIFDNENGIDAGGLRRELSSELVKDINEEKIGLFIKTPNYRNHEGKYQDCMIPSPNPEISNSCSYYQAIGALISIGIRSRSQQPDLVFPPLFWNYLVTGKLSIDDIYSIDKSYKKLITNIWNDFKTMSDEEFENQYSSVSFLNSRGAPIKIQSLSGLFTSRKIKKDNFQRIIAECNEARINEIRIPLENIRNGFWENMNFAQPLFVTPNLIELLACGERIISAEKLKNTFKFELNVPNNQRKLFNEVIDRMSNDQRRKLIHFCTGLSTLTNIIINVDFLDNLVDQRLPSSSTCFLRLHLPPFSTTEKMYDAFDTAINETGTFENG